MIDCDGCGRPFDPVASRWLCPHCKTKNSCCEGAPLRLTGPSAHDVAAFILAQISPLATSKLHRLVYYCQAWHLVWALERLFGERIEAWPAGPVVRDLFDAHRDQFSVIRWTHGNPDLLTAAQADTVQAVLDAYGNLSGRRISYLARAEQPWRDARNGLAPTEVGSAEISVESIQRYYTSVDWDDNAVTIDRIE